MKSRLFYLYLTLHLLACNSASQPIEKTWISKYHLHNEGIGEEVIASNTLKGLIRFDKDSVAISSFQFMDVVEKEVEKFKYTFYDTSLILFNFSSNETDTIPVLLNDSQLIVRVSPEMGTVFESLPTYHQAKEAEKLVNYLTSFTYKIVTDTFEVFYEFQKDYTTFSTTPHLKLFIKEKAYWKWNQYGTELFLELDDFYGNVMHIKAIKEKEIIGVIYDKEDREIILERVLPQDKFDPLDLIGEWEEIVDYPLPPPPPPPPVGVRYYDKEILKISENELIRHRDLGSDTVQWQMNRLKDKLFIPKYFYRIGAWTIEKLDDEHLTIKRKWIYSRGLGFRWASRDRGQDHLIQHIKFRKIKVSE
jgi:hypothetical protein